MAEGWPEGPATTTTARVSVARRPGARWPARTRDESNWLITVPLVVLAVAPLVAGFLQAPAFNIEKFKEWVEPAGVAVLYDERGRAGRRGARAAAPAEGEGGGRRRRPSAAPKRSRGLGLPRPS